MKTYFITLLFLITSIFSINGSTKIKDPEKDKVIIYVLKSILTRGHYLQKEINDDFSEYVYHSFINDLDPSKRYFTQQDLKEFSRYKFEIDDQLKNNNLDFYKLVYNRFLEKTKNAKQQYTTILATPFNYNKKEVINVDYEKIPFAKNKKELTEYWRKQLKLQVIDNIKDLENQQQEKLKKDKNTIKKSFSELEKEAREKVKKNMEDLYLRIEELEHADWYSTFLNSVVSAFDPHTTYMSPRSKTRFDQSMSGKLEGIGARLIKRGIYTEVYQLVSGGPAWKQGELEAGDIILKVAQANGEPLDIVGMRLDDAIKFIKGPKGTEVRLTVKKKVDGSIQVISIIRDVVELEETFVKSSVVIKNEKKYGIINLPKFYIDFSNLNSRNASKDMEQEIMKLKQEGVEGLIVDLRDNGGGSLKTVIEIAGLFIKKGPIVQVKYRGEAPVIKRDEDAKIQWDGPLVVMVNELSASASEIFAAAIQDYRRGVIMGGKQTYGKGTVQNILPISKFAQNYPDKNLGALKLTIQKFYRINGGSTQIEGVYSDIAMPDKYSYMDFGERDLKGALPWDKVAKAKYKQTNTYANFNDVLYNSKNRINNNVKFNAINNYAKWLRKKQDDTIYSLNYNEYTKEAKAIENEAKNFKNVFTYQSNLTFDSPKYEYNLFKKDSALQEKRITWHKNLAKDIYINEALNVLTELKLAKSHVAVKH